MPEATPFDHLVLSDMQKECGQVLRRARYLASQMSKHLEPDTPPQMNAEALWHGTEALLALLRAVDVTVRISNDLQYDASAFDG